MSDETLYYFDNNATTRVAPEVLEAMLPYLTEQWGNPSSAYSFGNRVGESVSEAREKVAALINADPREIIFTSCGTESNNAALNSALLTQPGKRHLVTTAVEHSANMKFGQMHEKRGGEVSWIPVDRAGQIDVHELQEAIREDTAAVSVMLANNETGVVQPLASVAEIAHSHGAVLHCDAVQAAGKIEVTGRVGPKTWQALGTLLTSDPPVPDPSVVNKKKLDRGPLDPLDGPPHVTCRAWAIADAETGQVLWQHDAKRKLHFASTTKIMTAFVVLQLAEADPAVLDQEIVFSERADRTGGSSACVRAGERLSVGELLYGLMLPSGNDASVRSCARCRRRRPCPDCRCWPRSCFSTPCCCFPIRSGSPHHACS